MLKSMTGFGTASGQVEGVEYSVEIRSVNNRYAKISLRLPESIQSLESRIEQAVRAKVSRGSVSLAVRMKLPEDQAAYRVNAAALASYLDQLRILEIDANPMFRVDLSELLQLPGVCEPPPLEEIAQKTSEGLLALIDLAIDGLIDMRRREGEALAADLLANAEKIQTELKGIAVRAGDVVKLYHEKLAARVEELTSRAKIHIDEETLAREVAIFAERSDIAEELSRLGTHVAEFRGLCETEESVGRKLDFMSQEMLREANTIASKGSDAEIARAVVDIKTAIDRIKEQAANVE
ncbi:MAG: YicC family protein [Phycisphaerae bacterium]|nr:YicC family protein [Phycisphaerae bacterium]